MPTSDLPDIGIGPTVPAPPPFAPAPAAPPLRVKTLPDIEVLAYPSDGLPRTLFEPFAGEEVIARLVTPQSGESARVARITPGDIQESSRLAQWDGQTNFIAIDPAITFTQVSSTQEGDKSGARAAHNGSASNAGPDLRGELSGFSLARSSVPLHFRLQNFDPARDPSGAPEQKRGHYHAFRPVVWRAGRGILRSATAPDGTPIPRKAFDLRGKYKGLKSHWETVVDAQAPRRQRVFHSCQAPDDVVWVETVAPWEENLGFEIDLTDLQIARGQKGQARIRIEWGGLFSVVLRDGAAPTFEKRLSASEKAAQNPARDELPGPVKGALPEPSTGAPPTWKTPLELGRGGPVNWDKINRLRVGIERIAGRVRLTVRFGDANPAVYDIINRRDAPNSPANENGGFEAVAAAWPRAPIRVSFSGVSAHMGGGELRALDVKTGLGLQGRYARRLRTPGKQNLQSGVSGGVDPRLHPMGWARDQTSVQILAAQIYNRQVGRGLYERALAYVCELSASPDGKDVPLLTNIPFGWEGLYQYDERAPLDITPACVGSARIQTGQPPDVPTSEMSLKVDDVILRQLALPGDAAAGTYRNYVSKYHRIRLRARWNYSDGSQDEYETLFDGAIYSPARNTARLLQQDLSLTCRDRIMRCSKPWAFIDQKYRAGGFLLAEKTNKARRNGPGGAFAFWGVELIHDILRITFGDEVANSLNGGVDAGDPDARTNGMLRFCPANQPPIFESGHDVTGLIALQGPFSNQGRSIPMTGQLMFPPPYRQSAIDWIRQIAALDQLVFYWGYPPGIAVENPVPIIGKQTLITKAAHELGTYEIPDAQYGGEADADTAMMSIESRLLVERDITRVVTYAGQVGADAAGLMPSIASGEARFDPGPPGDPEDTGERTLLIESDALLLAGTLTRELAGLNRFMEGISQLALDEYAGIKQEDISISMRGDASLRWGREIRPQMHADGGETAGQAGDYSYDAMQLHDRPYHVQRVEHTISFAPGGGEGGGAWEMNVSARPIATTGL